jgi:acyl carrier protein
MTTIEQVINDYIVQECMFDQPDAVLDNDEHLIESGIIDSLGIFVLVGFLEKRFGVKIQPEDVVLANFRTVVAVKDLVAAKLSATGAAEKAGPD